MHSKLEDRLATTSPIFLALKQACYGATSPIFFFIFFKSLGYTTKKLLFRGFFKHLHVNSEPINLKSKCEYFRLFKWKISSNFVHPNPCFWAVVGKCTEFQTLGFLSNLAASFSFALELLGRHVCNTSYKVGSSFNFVWSNSDMKRSIHELLVFDLPWAQS